MVRSISADDIVRITSVLDFQANASLEMAGLPEVDGSGDWGDFISEAMLCCVGVGDVGDIAEVGNKVTLEVKVALRRGVIKVLVGVSG